jgi:thymidylate synthase
LTNYFLTHFKPDELFLTEYKREPSKALPEILELIKPDEHYVLNSFSEWSESKDYRELGRDVHCRYLNYSRTDTRSCEHQYLELCKTVLDLGNRRPDRTGTGTLSLFGTQMRFDLTRGLPLLTTKRVAWKSCIEELLWFLRGDTDARILQKKGVKIWDGNSTRNFLDNQGLTHYEDGVLGPIYGWQWRFFGSPYYPIHSDTSKSKPTDGFDQIEELIKGLRKDPFGRRHVVSAWNPTDISNMALPPCHYTFQFYVEQDPDTLEKYLSCHFIMRSNDLGCGTSFNLLSYAVLTHLIALKVGMIPKELVYTCSDTHIYINHIDALRTQLERKPVAAPRLWIRPEVATKDWNQIELSDFEIIGYFPHSTVKMEMAI